MKVEILYSSGFELNKGFLFLIYIVIIYYTVLREHLKFVYFKSIAGDINMNSKLVVNDKEISINDFVDRILASVNLSIVNELTLDDPDIKKIVIEIK